MKKLEVGIIGCGTIGRALAHWIEKKFRSRATIRYITDHSRNKAKSLCRELHTPVQIVSIRQLIEKSDLIVEAASAEISNQVVEMGLKKHKMVLVMSVGGLLGSKKWFTLARQSRGRVWIPSGAITGVDGIQAGRNGRIKRIKLITRKPPGGLKGAPYFRHHRFPALKNKGEVCVFKGSAQQAVQYFPRNINVAAILSLAGIGAHKTRVEIWTSHHYRSNEHEVLVEGDFGKIRTVTSNVPSPENPKTSYLAILSAVAVMKKIFSSIEIGT